MEVYSFNLPKGFARLVICMKNILFRFVVISDKQIWILLHVPKLVKVSILKILEFEFCITYFCRFFSEA